ncbi:MAG: response regulator [Bacteroidales bacterium]|nr:response regulator [Bacteroidales bacterium]
MDESLIIGLINNIAFALCFSMLYDYFWINAKHLPGIVKQIVLGSIIGAICIVLMMTSGKLFPGIFLDTRSVILSISGLFFGFIPTAVAMLVASVYRIFVGGDGVYMGVAVIISSGTIGVLWGSLKKSWRDNKPVFNLLALGTIVHIAMLLCTTFLPNGQVVKVAKSIIMPLLLIYVPGNVLLGWLMLRQEKNAENRLASKRLSESERRFTELLSNINLLSIIYDLNGKVNFANNYFYDLTGYKSKEVINYDWIPLLIERNQRKIVRSKMVNPQLETLYEFDILSKSGDTIKVLWNNVVLRDDFDEPIGIASIGQNVTAQRVAESKLIEAKDLAVKSDKLKSIFLANVSHEIRTPLNAIVGFSELFADDNVDQETRKEYYQIIKSSSDNLLSIINDILDLSKLESKQMQLNLQEFNLSNLMNSTFMIFKEHPLLKVKQEIELVMDFPESLHNLVFLSDSVRVQQVLDNLILNAIKYTEKGTIKFGVNRFSDKGNICIEFYVQDTGLGISPENCQMIFERFRQVEEDVYHQGAGLGLSISKGIVDLLDGQIWVDSKLGKGSKFVFNFKIGKHTTVDARKSVDDNEFANINGKKILVGEDDYNSFYFIKVLLKNFEIELMHAANGKQVVEMAREFMPDLVLLDLSLPEKSGFECFDEIKDISNEIKIIAQTAYASEDDRDKCLSLGFDEFIKKPIKRFDFYNIINEILKP